MGLTESLKMARPIFQASQYEKSHYFANVEYPTFFIVKINSFLAFFCFVGFGRLLSSQAEQGR